MYTNKVLQYLSSGFISKQLFSMSTGPFGLNESQACNCILMLHGIEALCIVQCAMCTGLYVIR